MSNPAFKTVVFDLDGTLCDTIALIMASFADAHRQVLGRALDAEQARRWIGRTLVDVYAAYPGHEQQLVDAYLRFNLAHLEELQTDFDGIPELLDDLRRAGVTIGVATSKMRPSAMRSLTASGLQDKIPVLCAMEDTDAHKPSPAPLLKALAAVGADPSTAAYVGDAVVDLQAARAAGCAQIGVTWGAGDRDDLLAQQPTALCDTVADLHRVLLG